MQPIFLLANPLHTYSLWLTVAWRPTFEKRHLLSAFKNGSYIVQLFLEGAPSEIACTLFLVRGLPCFLPLLFSGEFLSWHSVLVIVNHHDVEKSSFVDPVLLL